MKIFRHTYSERLYAAAESFLVDQFSAPTQFTEASHLPDLIDAAMHIVTGAAWVQSEGPRRVSLDAPVDEEQYGEDEDEDEDDE